MSEKWIMRAEFHIQQAVLKTWRVKVKVLHTMSATMQYSNGGNQE
jgi:hypothetical protein